MCDGRIEPDLWEALITAGACWRAARAQPSMKAEWEANALMYSDQASTLVEWDAASWRWPVTTEARQ